MHDFLKVGKRPADPRALLQQIREKYPDPGKQWQIFFATVVDDRVYLRAVVEHAFNDWISRSHRGLT